MQPKKKSDNTIKTKTYNSKKKVYEGRVRGKETKNHMNQRSDRSKLKLQKKLAHIVHTHITGEE